MSKSETAQDKLEQDNPSDDEYRDCCKVNAYKAVSELRKRLEGGE